MTRKTYFIILASVLTFLFVFRAFSIYLSPLPDINAFLIQLLLVLYIIIYETVKAKRIFRRLNFSLLPLLLLTYLFKIQHWPFGKTGFTILSAVVLASLIINALTETSGRFQKILPLLFAISFFLLIATPLMIHHLVNHNMWVVPGTAILLWIVAFRSSK